MGFSGKATYSGGSGLAEMVDDVSDLVSIVSPHETGLLDALGDPLTAATSTRHEWLEDEILPNQDAIDDAELADTGTTTVNFDVENAGRFRVGDLLQVEGRAEVMLVTALSGSTLTVSRGYGGTMKSALADELKITILGNASLEGADAGPARFTVRARQSNVTQIFAATVQVSGTEAAVRQIGVDDEMAYQKTNRLRELLRDLENTVINGVAPDATVEGSATVRRTLRGILNMLSGSAMALGSGLIPSETDLSEEHLNQALRTVWERSGGKPDLIVCGGSQKRRINGFIATAQRFAQGAESFKSLVNTYESDYGVCRVVLSRYVPSDAVILLDSSKISVLPLVGRSFHFKPLASTGDFESGELIGEYTLELRGAAGHGVLRGLNS